MNKRLLTMLLALTMLLSSGTILYADNYISDRVNENIEQELRLNNIYKFKSNMEIISGYADVYVYIRGNSGVDKVKIISKIQRYSGGKWQTIKTYSKTKKSKYASISENYELKKGYYYRLKTTFKAYKNGSSETVTKTSKKIKY